MDVQTSFTQRLLDYQLAQIISEIDELQLGTAKGMPQDVAELERLHDKIQSLIDHFPPSLAVSRRGTSHDNANPFLRPQAELLKCSVYCLIVNLHRPFILTLRQSRLKIGKVGIQVLESQQRLLDATDLH